jgi:hypothetical protein
MFFYMRFEKHLCNAMSRGLLIQEYVEFMFVRYRFRATYATGNDIPQTKLNCCIMNCGELHVQSCHSYLSHGSEDVARLRAFAVFLYAFRKTCMQCLVS